MWFLIHKRGILSQIKKPTRGKSLNNPAGCFLTGQVYLVWYTEIMEIEKTEGYVAELDVTKSGKGKKILGGCGCGCLIIILIIAGLSYWGYRSATQYVRDFEAQGYSSVYGQQITVGQDDIVQGPVVYLGQQVFIRGTINGDVAMMCQQLTIEGTINGNLDLLVQQVTIAESGVVTGDLHAEGVQMLKNDGEIRGKITGDYQLIKNDQQADTEKE